MKLHKILLILCTQYVVAQSLIAAPFAFVTNNGSANVTSVDIASNIANATIIVGSGPRGVAFTPDGRFAYVVNSTDATVSVINTLTNMTVGLPITVGNVPFGVAITPNGQFAYVTNSGASTISVISVSTNMVVDTIPLTTPNPHGIAITPDGSLAYVAGGNATTPGVFIINLTTNVEDTFIPFPAGSDPSAVAITPNGQFAYVTDSLHNNVTPIPIPGVTLGSTITVGTEPEGIAITADGQFAYVTNFLSNNVTQINLATNLQVAGSPIPLPTPAGQPLGIAIVPVPNGGATQAYIADFENARVVILNIPASSPVTLATFSSTMVGVGTQPFEVAITPVIPPSSFIGIIQQNIFLNITECILTMQWAPSPTTNIVNYEIFKNGVLFVTIPATGPLVFTTCLDCNDAGTEFTIAAVDSTGAVSIMVPIVIQPASTLIV